MSVIDNIFDAFYTKFFLRDLLSKVVPGLVTLAYFAIKLNIPIRTYLDGQANLFYLVLVYGISFAFGMLLQHLGERLRLININVWPQRRFLGSADNMESLRRLHIFLDETRKRPEVRSGRERVAIMKHISGTWAVSLSIILIGQMAFDFSNTGTIHFTLGLAICLFAIFLLILQNLHHGEEQRIWENFYTERKGKQKQP